MGAVGTAPHAHCPDTNDAPGCTVEPPLFESPVAQVSVAQGPPLVNSVLGSCDSFVSCRPQARPSVGCDLLALSLSSGSWLGSDLRRPDYICLPCADWTKFGEDFGVALPGACGVARPARASELVRGTVGAALRFRLACPARPSHLAPARFPSPGPLPQTKQIERVCLSIWICTQRI